jgi:hypothetical protein
MGWAKWQSDSRASLGRGIPVCSFGIDHSCLWVDVPEQSQGQAECLVVPAVRLHHCDARERVYPARSGDFDSSFLHARSDYSGSDQLARNESSRDWGIAEGWVSGRKAVLFGVIIPIGIAATIPLLFFIGSLISGTADSPYREASLFFTGYYGRWFPGQIGP